jgi:hypothetical protein
MWVSSPFSPLLGKQLYYLHYITRLLDLTC